MPMNVSQAITPAMEHTSRLLFKPFVLRKWLALGLVATLAGMAGNSSGGHYNTPSGSSNSGTGDFGEMAHVMERFVAWIVGHIALIVLGVVAVVVLSVLLSWLASVFRFVFLHQITRAPLAIREPFHRFKSLGTSYFLWQLAFSLFSLLALGVLVGLPLLFAFAGKADTGVKAIAIGWSIVVGAVLFFAIIFIDLFARDFVTPAMLARGIGVIDAWHVIIPIIGANIGQCILYILLLIAISIVTGIGAVFAVLAVGIAFTVPAGLLALIGWGVWSATGNHLTPVITAYALTVGIPLLLAFGYILNCAMLPFTVFRRTFALAALGQADPSLALIPLPPTAGPRQMPTV